MINDRGHPLKLHPRASTEYECDAGRYKASIRLAMGRKILQPLLFSHLLSKRRDLRVRESTSYSDIPYRSQRSDPFAPRLF